MTRKAKIYYSAAAIALLIVIVVGWSFLRQDSTKLRTVRSDSGEEVECNKINVIFEAGATQAMIDNAIKLINAKISSSVPEIKLYLLEIPGDCSYKEIMNYVDAVKDMPGVQSAEPNGIATVL